MSHKEFFEKNGGTKLISLYPSDDEVEVEDLYQAFKARMLEEMAEEKNKLLLDLVTTGSSFELNGKRIPPENVFKSVWDDAPDWANWRAQDAGGEWWWFSNRPSQIPHREEWNVYTGDISFHQCDTPNPNWRDTLQERPRKQNSED